jgi:hypothetical protein
MKTYAILDIHYLGIVWKEAVSFTPWPLYSMERTPLNQCIRWLGPTWTLLRTEP